MMIEVKVSSLLHSFFLEKACPGTLIYELDYKYSFKYEYTDKWRVYDNPS